MKKILLIDDEKDFCAVVKKRLELISDYRVIPAYSAKEGIRAAIWKKPDLILLDILLPDMGGLELLERIKKDTRTMSIPVIVLTAKEDDETKLNAAGLYDDDYIVKPVEMNILKSKIDNVLARKKPAPQ